MAPGGMAEPSTISTSTSGEIYGIVYRSRSYVVEWPTTGSWWGNQKGANFSPAWWGNAIDNCYLSPEKHRERWNAYYHGTIVKVPHVREVWPRAKKISSPLTRLRIPCLAAQRKAPVARSIRAMRNQIKQSLKARPEHRPV